MSKQSDNILISEQLSEYFVIEIIPMIPIILLI